MPLRSKPDIEPPEEHWLAEPLLPARKQTGLSAWRSDGKSLLSLDISARKAAGRRCLDTPAEDPIHVIYMDYEMGPDDLYTRLYDLGWAPDHPAFDTLVTHLHYNQLPTLPPLDTKEGGDAVEELVIKHDADLLAIDTVSRVISGKEIEAEPFKELFRWTESRLKRRGVTLLRLDHLGKDRQKGSRGSSAKENPLELSGS